MNVVDLEKRQARGERIRNIIGVIILAGAFLWSAAEVAYLTFGPRGESNLLGTNKKVIRIAHWQLEGGYVPGLEKAMREYEKLHPDVAVEQIPIPERAYGQWVQTQLMGRTAPDLIEMKDWFSASMVVRYFVPLTDKIDKPNSYNDGTDLAGVPWRDTYIDGMVAGYRTDLQDYYGMPTSCFTFRCFANADILKKVAGISEPPHDLTGFLALCQKIQDYARDNRVKMVPIAASDYTAGLFHRFYQSSGLYPLIAITDVDMDGTLTNGERLLAEFGGKINITTDPHWEATHKLLYELCRYYNPGFLAARRDDAVFLFTQGNAAMFAAGSWDAGSIRSLVENKFPVKVFDFPVPAPGEKYSNVIKDRVGEAGMTGGVFGLSKFSRNPEIAVDFMRFLTSQKANADVNRAWSWFPAIRGITPDENLKPFEPKVEGVFSPYDDTGIGDDTILRYNQAYKAFISTIPDEKMDYEVWLDKHYKEFVHQVDADFKQYMFKDFETNWKNAYSGGVQTEASLSVIRARAVHEGMTPELSHNLLALTLGQVRRMQVRAVDWSQYEEAKKFAAKDEQNAAAKGGSAP